MKTTIFKKQQEENFELFFEPDELPRVQYLLETKQFFSLARLKNHLQNNTGTKMQLSLSNGGKRITVQLFEYIFSKYIPVSPVMEFNNREAKDLSGVILSAS